MSQGKKPNIALSMAPEVPARIKSFEFPTQYKAHNTKHIFSFGQGNQIVMKIRPQPRCFGGCLSMCLLANSRMPEPLAPRKIIEKYMKPSTLYTDMTQRDVDSVPGDIDFYISGFPCQPYSKAGNMKGVDDVRSKPAEMVVHYIATKKPRSFCLENVYSLVESFPDWFNTIIFTLREISGDDGKLYEARRGENQERFQNFKDCLFQNLRFG